jgi:hypothetical protein
MADRRPMDICRKAMVDVTLWPWPKQPVLTRTNICVKVILGYFTPLLIRFGRKV